MGNYSWQNPSQPEAAPIFERHQLSAEFYQEVRHREAQTAMVMWYQITAEHHQQELRQMQCETNILRWFRGARD
jgi:hypothetical protein